MDSAISQPQYSLAAHEIAFRPFNEEGQYPPSSQLTKPRSAYTRSTCSDLPSIDSITDEKLAAAEQIELPTQHYNRISRYVRYRILSVYVRLSLFIIVTNVVIMISLCTVRGLGSVNAQTVVVPTAVNLAVAVLIRQEIIINALFDVVGRCPPRMATRFKKLAAKIYHLGGVHSGAGIAAALWFGVATYPMLTAPAMKASSVMYKLNFAVTLTLDFLLLIIVTMSHPHVRQTAHDIWEASHRYAGWSAIVLFWIHMLIHVDANRKLNNPSQRLARALACYPVFWCLIVVSISIVLPWLNLRRVDVVAEKLSGHAIRLHFKYTDIPLCATIRLSTSPLTEWHSFAGIPEQEDAGFSILVSRAGDWTSKIIEDSPQQLWTRGLPTQSVLRVARIFTRVVVLATGSGIGPVLSLLYASELDTRVIWSASDPINTYKMKIINQVLSADRHAIIIDTRQAGRPDLVREAYQLYKSSQAEAVFVVSNAKVTRMVVYALESRGVPVFAPIFDS